VSIILWSVFGDRESLSSSITPTQWFYVDAPLPDLSVYNPVSLYITSSVDSQIPSSIDRLRFDSTSLTALEQTGSDFSSTPSLFHLIRSPGGFASPQDNFTVARLVDSVPSNLEHCDTPFVVDCRTPVSNFLDYNNITVICPGGCNAPEYADAKVFGGTQPKDVFASHSSLCRAAIFAGVVNNASASTTVDVFIPTGGTPAFYGGTQNNLTAVNFTGNGESNYYSFSVGLAATQVSPATVAPANVNDAAILIDRGNCTFRRKAQAASLMGARLVIIINYNDETFSMGNVAGHSAADPTAGIVMVSSSMGAKLRSYMAAVDSLNTDGYAELRVHKLASTSSVGAAGVLSRMMPVSDYQRVQFVSEVTD
jgi:LCCL domain/PA domain